MKICLGVSPLAFCLGVSPPPPEKGRLGLSQLYIGECQKGLRILRVARETSAESTSILPGVTPARIEDDSPVVSQPWGKPVIILPWGKPVENLPWGKPVIILPWGKLPPPPEKARLGVSQLYIRTCPKGLRIFRVARETRNKPRSICAGATPGRTASVYPGVSQPWGKPVIILPCLLYTSPSPRD